MALDIITIEQGQYTEMLKTPAKKVEFPLGVNDKALIAAMKSKLYDLGGVGLAAPQVNHSKQIIAIYIPEEAGLLRDNVIEYPMHTMLNPSYQPILEEGDYSDFEGCYSVSSKAGKVTRYQSIRINYYDESGTEHQINAHGFYARVLQHEIDHLQGVLITDRLSSECVQGTVEEMMALRREGLSEEKKAIFDKVMTKKLKK